MGASHDLGRDSEKLAANYLIDRGYALLERNYRVGHKEIDLIAAREATVAFVEVKARAGSHCGHPLEAITWAKRRELAYAARVWIAANGRPGMVYRFDAIAINWQAGQPVIEHIPDAWRL
ncbi:MAG TPA: YraN family protein [Longimicrobiales bacterium]|nr:YraN family protein [Longimicrobiales bacterium]